MDIKKLVYDKIVIMVILYVIFVVCSLTSMFVLDTYVNKRIGYLNTLYINETAKIQLNDILKNKISRVRVIMLDYLNAASFNDMDKSEKEISETIEHLATLLYVIENGGVYTEEININYKGLDVSEQTVSLSKGYSSKYNIQAMDLRAKLIEIKHIMDDLRSLVIDSILSSHTDDINVLKNIAQRESIAVKTMDAFFKRMDESSNRLYMESNESESFIKAYLINSKESFDILKLRVNFVLGIIMIVSGLILCRKVYIAVKQRHLFSKELNELNEKLEETVRKRTLELETEIKIRKQKEAQSTEEAKFLMDVIESLSHPFYVIDANTYEILHANTAAYNVIGRSGSTCYELTHHQNHPCDGLDHPCPLNKVKETGASISVEHIHYNKEGQKRYVEVHGYPVKDSEGNVVQMIEYSLDITDKKEAEVALINLNAMLEEKVAERTKKLENEIKNREIAEKNVKTRERYFRQLISNVSDVVAIVDEHRVIKYVTPSVEQASGFRADQLIGKTMDDFVHQRDVKTFEIWVNNLIKSPEELKTTEIRLKKHSGSYMFGEAVGKNLLHDEVIEGIIVNVRDISVRKYAEEEMRKLALVMEQNPNSILVTDPEGNIEYVNPSFEKVTGYASGDVIGKNANILKTEETPEEVFKDLWGTISKGNVWQGEFINKAKDGRTYIEHAIIAPIKNDKKEIISYLGMKENITELRKAREKAEESSKAKSNFMANMSHEIKTPLNSLMGFLDLLAETGMSSEQSEYVSNIKFSASTLLDILNDILDISKIENNQINLDLTHLDISSSISSTVRDITPKAKDKGININTAIDTRIPQILMGDSGRINQVLKNLLNNAVKFSPEGGDISVNALLLKEMDNRVNIEISVSDNGEGISESKIESIFESFTQEDISETRKYGGVGLGLTIVKQILKIMGSDIHVKSKKGEGSTFYFHLELEKVSVSKEDTETNDDGVLDIEKAIKDMGLPRDVAYELISGYCKNLINDLDDMRVLTAEENFEKLNSIVHSYKGAATNLRLELLIKIFSDIENMVTLKNKDGIIEGIDKIYLLVNNVLTMIKQVN